MASIQITAFHDISAHKCTCTLKCKLHKGRGFSLGVPWGVTRLGPREVFIDYVLDGLEIEKNSTVSQDKLILSLYYPLWI